MFKTTKEFDNAMALILNGILEQKPLSEIEQYLGIDEFCEAIMRCHELKFIIGLTCTRTDNNGVSVQENNPKVSYLGLTYLGL